jgi:uncharacterized membrane protein
MNKSRFEAASDGVFAIAITLLVLGLAVPIIHPPQDAKLSQALIGLWPNFLAYALSFAVIGIMWNNHHMLFRSVQRIDRTTFLLNLILLGITAFIPFASALLGTYPQLKASTVMYGLTLDAASITYNGILHYLIRRRAFFANITEGALRQTVFHYRVGLVTYLTATVFAFVYPWGAFALYGAIVLYYLFPRGVDADAVSVETGNP